MRNVIYEYNYNDPAPHSWFSNCCGAKYYKTLTEKSKERIMQSRFITVALGDQIPEYSDDKTEVVHVKTKNGTITVKVRHAW